MPTKILVVDDHSVVRQGVKQILEDIPNMVVVGEASTGGEALAEIRAKSYDIVLLDISLPQQNGLEVLKQILQIDATIKVLILSMHPEKQYAVRALRAGASGYLTKDTAPTELITAVEKIANGQKYVTLSLAEQLVAELSSDYPQEPHQLLSNREYQVMILLAKGETISEIGETLSISAKTVSTYRTRLLEKLNLNKTAEIIRYAIQNNLVD